MDTQKNNVESGAYPAHHHVASLILVPFASVPIFGSGITRIKEHKNISDEDLLKIMLWTFRNSEMRFLFKYPAKLTILVHKKIDTINFFDIKMAYNKSH